MCQPKTKGGRRCATHTRPGYSQALLDVLDAGSIWEARHERERSHARVLTHALTPAGRREIEHMAEDIYNSRRSFVDGMHTARWLLFICYEADEENRRTTA